MVVIDTVYQRVLAFANKEQRGYITPQEFNLFANQAQMEIFEQYFYDINQAARTPGNNYVYADVDDMLEEKLQMFEVSDGTATIAAYPTAGANARRLPAYVYRVHRIEYDNANCEILKTKDFNDVRQSGALLAPTDSRPIANVRSGLIRVVASNDTFVVPTGLFYFKKPVDVAWGYFVVSGVALYNPAISTNFQLHESEQTELVYKILKFAGVSMKREDILKAGQGMEMTQIQQEKQ